MSEQDDQTTPPPAEPPRPRPGGASAASRARRIGGGAPVTPRTPAAANPVEPAPAATDAPADDAHEDPDSDDTSTAIATPSSPSLRKSSRATDRGPAIGDSDSDTDTDDKSTPRTRRSVPAWAAWLPAAALLVAAIVLGAIVVADRVGGDSAPASTGSKLRQTVLAAAKECVVATNSYKYTDINGAKAKALKCATGEYATKYANAMDTLVKPTASTLKANQTAQVNVAGIESVSKSGAQWGILVYGQLNVVSSATGAKGRIDPFALVATMQQARGNWVIAKIAPVSTTSG